MSWNKKWILVWESNFLHDNKWSETDERLKIYAESEFDGVVTFTTHFGKIEVGNANRLVATIYSVEEVTDEQVMSIQEMTAQRMREKT